MESDKVKIARLEKEVANLKAKKSEKPELSLKVGVKGGVSVYNLQKFPVTLYKEQWLALLEYADSIKQFITDHDDELAVKEQ